MLAKVMETHYLDKWISEEREEMPLKSTRDLVEGAFGIFPDGLSIDLYAGVDAIKNGRLLMDDSSARSRKKSRLPLPRSAGTSAPCGGRGSKKAPARKRLSADNPNAKCARERDCFGWLPAEITRAVTESVINIQFCFGIRSRRTRR
jgi:hypothetical protein